MAFNFHVHPVKKYWREVFLFFVFIWMLIFRNFLLIHELGFRQSTATKSRFEKPSSIMALCSALTQLPAGGCVIQKMDIHSHEMFLYGQATKEEDLGVLIRYFNQIREVLKVEVIQWDFIKSGHWRFIIVLDY